MPKLIRISQRFLYAFRNTISLLALGSLLASSLSACGSIPGFAGQRATQEPNVAPYTATLQFTPPVVSSPSGTFTRETRPVAGSTAVTIPPTRTPETQLAEGTRADLTDGPKLSCDKAAPGLPIDVTIADGTPLVPGEAFTKVWRLVNAGTCTWTRSYTADWFSGARLGGLKSIPFDEDVRPGESVDISVDMVAPQTPGEYQSNWKLRNGNKEWFGIGPDGEQAFWVKILVVQVSTDTPLPRPTRTTAPTHTPTLTPTLTSTPTLTPTLTPTPTLTITPTLTSTSSPAGYLSLQTKGESGRERSGLSHLEPGNQVKTILIFFAPLAALHETLYFFH